MTADEKKIQDLCIEIDKMKAELEKSKKELEESKRCLQEWCDLVVKYPRAFGKSIPFFFEHPEQCKNEENR